MEYGPKVFAICDWEKEFGLRLMEYVQEKRHMTFEMHVFTDLEHLMDYARQRKISILLISNRFMNDEIRQLKIDRLVILAEGSQQEKYDDYPHVYKYQPADRLMREIMQELQDKASVAEGERAWRRRKNIFAVISPAGCRNQIYFSVALGRLLSRRYRVLYINLQGLSGLGQLLEEGKEENLSDLIYCYRRSKEAILQKLRAMTGSIVNMDYLPPVHSPDDLYAVSGEEMADLLREIMEKSSYEILVLDLEATLPYMPHMMDLADRIFRVSEEDSISKAKNIQFEGLLQQSGSYALQEKILAVDLPQIRMRREGKNGFEEAMRNGIGMTAEKVIGKILE